MTETLLLKARNAVADYPFDYISASKLARLIGCSHHRAGHLLFEMGLKKFNSKQWIISKRSHRE
jgi:hypothetical protein